MKKILAASLLGTAFAFTSAAHAVSDAGCGLGSIVFEGKEGIPFNILAATTNGTSGNQTFGMTTGTLNCGEGKFQVAMSLFVNDNLDSLAMDSARGEGETIDTLAAMWGMEEADRAHFASLVQSRFDEIFTSQDATAEDVLNNFNRVISEDAELSGYALS